MNELLNGKTIFAVAMAFLLPITVVAVMHADTIREHFEPDPSVGKVLYFYSPG